MFERKTVVPLHELTAEVVRQSYGEHALPEIKAALHDESASLLHADGKVTTREALELERALVAKLNARAGTLTELGYLTDAAGSALSSEQRTAVTTILGSGDRAVVLRGKAGTGKTHVLASAIEGMALINRDESRHIAIDFHMTEVHLYGFLIQSLAQMVFMIQPSPEPLKLVVK